MIARERSDRRGEGGIADAHAHAGEQDVGEVARRGAERDAEREGTDTERHDPRPAAPLAQPRDRQAEHRVEDGEAETLDDAELGIGKMQIRLQCRRARGDALAIREVEHVDHRQQEQHPGPIAPREPCFVPSASCDRFTHARHIFSLVSVWCGCLPARLSSAATERHRGFFLTLSLILRRD